MKSGNLIQSLDGKRIVTRGLKARFNVKEYTDSELASWLTASDLENLFGCRAGERMGKNGMEKILPRNKRETPACLA